MERYYLRDFYIFIYVAETKSLSQTAKIMLMSVSSVSKRLSWLESYFNVILFDKNTRKVELTTEGRKFYQKILSIIDEFEIFIKEIKTPEMKLCFNTYGGLFESFLTDFCYKYCLDNNCDLSVYSFNEGINNVGFEDVYIIDEKLNYPHAVHRKLSSIKRGCFIHSKYIDEIDFNSTSLFESIPLVYFKLYGNDMVLHLTKGDKKYFLSGKGLHVTSMKKIINLMLSDKCIAVGVPIASVKNLLRENCIIEVLPKWRIESKNMYIVWKKRSYRDVYFDDLLESFESRWSEFFC